MSGYQETLTDPSYHRQVVVMTAPHVGNTGMNDEDPESGRIWVSGYVVRDPARRPSSWRSKPRLDDELRDAGRRRHLRRRHPGADPAPARARRDAGRHLHAPRPTRRRCSSGCSASAEMAGAELATEVSTSEAYVVPAVGDEAVHRRGGRPRHQGEHAADDGRARHRGARAARDLDPGRRARDRRRRGVLLQRPGGPGRHRGPGRAAQVGAGARASPTSGSASATSSSAGRWASAPSS